MGTLLEKVKSQKKSNRKNSNVTDEHIEVALSWVKGEISMAQIVKGMDMGKAGGVNVYVFLANALKVYIQKSNQ